MPSVIKRTFSLPNAQSEYIDKQGDSGTYGSASEMVRAGLRALQEGDAAVERWLVEQVVPAYDAMLANPGQGKSIDEVFGEIRAHEREKVMGMRKQQL